MKHRLALVLALFTVLALAACSSHPDAVPAGGAGLSASDVPQSTPAVHIMHTPPPTPSAAPPSPTPTATPTPTPVPTPFSIIWLSDTQTMTYRYKQALARMGEWMEANREALNVRCVVQTGDSVENGFNPRYWENFDLLYLRFNEHVPYIPVAGNHDIAVNHHDYAAFLARPFFSGFSDEQLFEGGKALWFELNEGGRSFLILGAGWEAEEQSIDFLNDALRAHPDSTAILLFHGYVQQDGRFTLVGKRMFDALVKPNPNVKYVLCGHVHGTGARVDALDDDSDGEIDRNVYGLLYNYQKETTDCGQLRIMTFDPMQRSLTITTYSPYTEKYYKDYFFNASTFTIEDAF